MINCKVVLPKCDQFFDKKTETKRKPSDTNSKIDMAVPLISQIIITGEILGYLPRL